MKLLDITIQVIACCWVASYASHVNAQTQDMANQSCSSVSGIYQLLGQDDDEPNHHSYTFLQILFNTLPISGATATELNYDSASSTLRIRIRRDNLEPDPDFSLRVECKDGTVMFEDSKKGHADGSSYEMKSVFRISKDSSNTLVVHKFYTVKSTNLLFFWKERNGEAHVRFKHIE